AAARDRDRLVAQASLLPAHADLDQHEVGALERAVEVAGQVELAAVALAVEHPLRQPPDHLAALVVDVVQHELVERYPLALAREPGHELGRVGRASADDGELHPFTPVSVTPSTNARCAQKN